MMVHYIPQSMIVERSKTFIRTLVETYEAVRRC